jgi:hypothetical protein
MDVIPEEKLQAIKPLLFMMYTDSVSVETVAYEDMDDEEKAAFMQGRKEYEEGRLIDFEDYMKERGIEA